MPSRQPGNSIRRLAAAKINLFLHVTGQRSNGYHELDSLVAFASFGDWIDVSLADDISLKISGAEAGALSDTATADNLVIQAARLLADRFSVPGGAAIALEKNLPVASGIGGGSADAAATLRALVMLWGINPTPDELTGIGLELGADVPVCLASRTRRMTGIGERLHEVPYLPVCHMVLVNPRVGLSTPEVFAALHKGKWRASAPATPLPSDLDFLSLIMLLKQQVNDLQAPAIRILPVIGNILTAIEETKGCRLARMSGSGATCFGLFESSQEALAAAEYIRQISPAWWIATGQLGDAAPDLRQAYTG
jgi:4-diphosphocytidyl-2-C-methyl-D-erythritol kinase